MRTNKILTLFFIMSCLILISCNSQEQKIRHFFGSTTEAISDIDITSAVIQNNQIIFSGTGLKFVSSIQITGPSSFNEIFTIQSQNNSSLVAISQKVVSFLYGETYDILLTNPNGTQTFSGIITLSDGAITAIKFNYSSANEGQILRFNGTLWATDDLNGLVYAGGWDANTNTPDLSYGGVSGEYYIVAKAGNTNLLGGNGTDSWEIGNWVIWNNALDRWEKIDNEISIRTFNGRSGAVTPAGGDYSWDQIDKTISSISDLSDVDTTDASVGSILKWDEGNSKWIIAEDNNTSITTSPPLSISDGTAPSISITKADSTTDGYISSSDIVTFSSKQVPITTTVATDYYKANDTTGDFSSAVLDATLTGLATSAATVSASDTILEAFNKIDANYTTKETVPPTYGDLTEFDSDVLIITNGSSAVMGTGTTIHFLQSNSTTNGYISNNDWDTFNKNLDYTDIDNTTIELNGSNQLQIKDGGINSVKRLMSITTKNTDYTITNSDNLKTFLVSNDTTITLPQISVVGSGFTITIKKTDSANRVVIDGYDLETINGNEVVVLENQYAYTTLISNGAYWYMATSDGKFSWCPANFIPVPGDSTLNTSDFCVMKYEAKREGGLPVSQALGDPWTSINGANAFAECESLTEDNFNGTFTLISNQEWMTIARNIEGVANNWSTGNVGNGVMATGWTASTVTDGFTNTSVATDNDLTCLYNTGADTCGTTGSLQFRRTLMLTNNFEIWDFAGNVREVVDWDSSVAGFTLAPTDATAAWQELSVLDGSITSNNLQSKYGFTSLERAGKWYGGTGGAAIRGGYYVGGDSGSQGGGPFTLLLNSNALQTSIGVGFRCVYRP